MSSIANNSLRFLYYRYKDSPYYSLAIIVLAISVCIMLFFQVIIPQMESWFSIRNEVIATRQRLEAINKNITFMNNVDKSVLGNQVTVSTEALPIEKDFANILNAMSAASLNSGVAFEDFTFQVGNVSSGSAQLSNKPQEVSAIKLTVEMVGSIDEVRQFLKEINEKLPLSEVLEVNTDVRSTTVSLQFYQKDFPRISFRDDQPLIPISDANTELIRKLTEWRPVNAEDATASNSGIPLF